MQLINQKTKQLENVPYEELGPKFLSGEYGLQKSTPVYLQNPDGELDQYVPEDVHAAVTKGGYKFPTTEQVKEHETKQKYGNRPLAAGALSAADAATFGMASRLGIETGAFTKETAKELPIQNPVASTVGTVAGIGGSLLFSPETALMKMAGETLALEKLTGTAASIAKATEEYKHARQALTGLDALNPVKALSKVGESTFDALAAVPITASTSQKIATKAMAGAASGALEAVAYGAGEINREDAIGNPNLTASHVMSELGYSALIGGGMGALVRGGLEGGKLLKSKMFPSGTFAEAVSDSVSEQSAKAGLAQSIDSTLAPLEPGGPISMKSLDEVADATKGFQAFGPGGLEGEALPTMQEAIDISNRLPIKLKPHAVQIESLRNPASRMKYDSFLEQGSEAAINEQKLQQAQKNEMTGLIKDTIKQISKEHTDDELAAGTKVAKKLDQMFDGQKGVLGPQFDKFDKAGSNVARDPEGIVKSLTEKLPGVEHHIGVELMEGGGLKLKIMPYSDALPYNQNVHRALGQIVSAVNKEDLTIGEIRNVTRKLGAKLQKTAESYGADKGVLGKIKGTLSDYVAEEIDRIDPSVGAKALNRDYAILKENENTIKSMLGGSIQEGAGYAKAIDPTKVIKNIFNPNDFNAVIAAKRILPTDVFNEALASKLSMMIKDSTDQQNKIFSSKKFSTLLTKNANVLKEALKDNPGALQVIKDAASLMKMLPDAGPVNVSRTAPVAFNLLKSLLHPADELKNAVFGIKEHFEKQTKEAVINHMLANPGTTFDSAEAAVNKKWRAYNTLSKLNEISDKSNRVITEKAKAAVAVPEEIAKRAVGPVSGKLATREEKQESHRELVSDFDKATNRINRMMADPQHMMKTLESASGDLFEAAPKTAQALQESTLKAVTFLSSKIPKKQTDSLWPEKLVPSGSDAKKFMGYVKTIEDPRSVLDSVKNNTISVDQIDALSAVHPDLYNAMRMEVMNQLVTLKKQPDYQKKLSLSLFLGQDVDGSLKPQMINANQNSFSMMKNVGSQQPSMRSVKPTATGLGNLNLADRSLMPIDKSANRKESK